MKRYLLAYVMEEKILLIYEGKERDLCIKKMQKDGSSMLIL